MSDHASFILSAIVHRDDSVCTLLFSTLVLDAIYQTIPLRLALTLTANGYCYNLSANVYFRFQNVVVKNRDADW